MRIEQLVQSNTLIESKLSQESSVKLVLYLLRFAFVSKLYQIKHHLYAALLGLFVWSLENDCVGKVVQSQNSTVAHKNPKR